VIAGRRPATRVAMPLIICLRPAGPKARLPIRSDDLPCRAGGAERRPSDLTSPIRRSSIVDQASPAQPEIAERKRVVRLISRRRPRARRRRWRSGRCLTTRPRSGLFLPDSCLPRTCHTLSGWIAHPLVRIISAGLVSLDQVPACFAEADLARDLRAIHCFGTKGSGAFTKRGSLPSFQSSPHRGFHTGVWEEDSRLWNPGF
jgi:hypothetical protein